MRYPVTQTQSLGPATSYVQVTTPCAAVYVAAPATMCINVSVFTGVTVEMSGLAGLCGRITVQVHGPNWTNNTSVSHSPVMPAPPVPPCVHSR